MSEQLHGIRAAAAVVVLAGGLSGLGATLSQIDESVTFTASTSAGSHPASLQRPFPLDSNDECSHDHDHSDHDHDHSGHDHDHDHDHC